MLEMETKENFPVTVPACASRSSSCAVAFGGSFRTFLFFLFLLFIPFSKIQILSLSHFQTIQVAFTTFAM